MKVLLVGNYVPHRQISMQRFASLLERGLQAQGHDVRLLRPPVVLGRLKALRRCSKWMGYIDSLVLFPKTLKKAAEWADVVHICDHSNAPYIECIKGKPHVVTCHDALAIRSAAGEIPENHTSWTGRLLQWLIRKGLQHSARVVCVSETTRSELLRVAAVAPAVTSVIYNGLNFPFYPVGYRESQPFLDQFGIANRPYILHVGNNNWYKNRLGVLRIFALLRDCYPSNLRLVLVGKPWTDEMKYFVAKHDLTEAVLSLIEPSNEALRALYSRAELLLFPSLQEGFGWPIIEAQACGCPVVTSDRMPMREIGGDAASYVDPLDPEAAADQVMARIGRRGGQPCRRSLENSRRFNTVNMIEQYCQIYRNLLGQPLSSLAVASAAGSYRS